MSRYDGLIIPRSYSEYINKTDAATLQQALQLSGVLSEAVAAGDNKAVKSSAVYEALTNYINKTDAATIQQALQLPGVLSEAVAAGDNKAVTSDAVKTELNANYYNKQSVDGLINKVKINFIEVEGVTGSSGQLSIPLSASHFILACYTNINDTYADVSHYEGTLYLILKSYDGTICSNAQVKATVAYL